MDERQHALKVAANVLAWNAMADAPHSMLSCLSGRCRGGGGLI